MNNKSTHIIFSQAMKIGLLAKYKKIPSCSFIAREFNLRCIDANTITPETARRWLNAAALPDIPKLITLSTWLELDLNTLFSIKKVQHQHLQKISNAELKNFISSGNKILHLLESTSTELKKTINSISN